jgi:hypothetical protein
MNRHRPVTPINRFCKPTVLFVPHEHPRNNTAIRSCQVVPGLELPAGLAWLADLLTDFFSNDPLA